MTPAATEHFTFEVWIGRHKAAGLGELGPGPHDLRVTLDAVEGAFSWVFPGGRTVLGAGVCHWSGGTLEILRTSGSSGGGGA